MALDPLLIAWASGFIAGIVLGFLLPYIFKGPL